jgi:hypothetical protein
MYLNDPIKQGFLMLKVAQGPPAECINSLGRRLTIVFFKLVFFLVVMSGREIGQDVELV